MLLQICHYFGFEWQNGPSLGVTEPIYRHNTSTCPTMIRFLVDMGMVNPCCTTGSRGTIEMCALMKSDVSSNFSLYFEFYISISFQAMLLSPRSCFSGGLLMIRAAPETKRSTILPTRKILVSKFILECTSQLDWFKEHFWRHFSKLITKERKATKNIDSFIYAFSQRLHIFSRGSSTKASSSTMKLTKTPSSPYDGQVIALVLHVLLKWLVHRLVQKTSRGKQCLCQIDSLSYMKKLELNGSIC